MNPKISLLGSRDVISQQNNNFIDLNLEASLKPTLVTVKFY